MAEEEAPAPLVFPRPRTLELRRMEVLETQVRELRAEVRSLKSQLQLALAITPAIPSQPTAPESALSQPEDAQDEASRKRKRSEEQLTTATTLEEAIVPAPVAAAAPNAAEVVSQAREAHVLVQTTEFRETKTAQGATGRKLRQRSCKVCSMLRGDRKRAFETTFFCEQCSAVRGGGAVYLCDRVRHHEGEQFRGVTCSQIWHVLWENGKALPVNCPTIRMRRTREATATDKVV